MKKLLILGGARAQVKLIKTAKLMGIYTIVVGAPGNYPGYQLADKYYPVDIFDKEGVLDVCKKEHVDGISMVCSDFGLTTVGYVCDKLNLPGISEKTASISSNKLMMKDVFIRNGVNTAKFLKMETFEDVDKAVNLLSFPMVVKAVDLQGSSGVYVVNNRDELAESYKKSLEKSRQNFCIVEEYIDGIEYGAQAFIYDGEILFIQPHGDLVWRTGKTNIPIGHYFPAFKKESDEYCKVYDICKKAILALHFNNCAVNIDFIMKDGNPYILELTGRAGANYLPELLSEYIGENYYKMIILSK